MTRRPWLLATVVILGGLCVFAIGYGRTGPASLWLDGDPDPQSKEISLFVSGGCGPDGEQIRSTDVHESKEAVVIDIRIKWPLGVGAPACGSYEGQRHIIPLHEPLGNRQVYVLNPDSSRSLIQLSPF
jgi:hypothetical protein